MAKFKQQEQKKQKQFQELHWPELECYRKKKTPAGKGGVGSDKQEGKPSEEATKKKRRKPRDTTLGNHRRWYRPQTPEKCRSIERVL